MLSDQPKRPPRISRGMSKDSSAGLLMALIRSLTASRDPEEREREKTKLEKEFQRSDELLDSLIEGNEDLLSAMKIYSSVASSHRELKQILGELIELLETTRSLVRLDITQLKKLLVEILERKYASEILEKYDDVRKVPEQINGYLDKKLYLHATKLLIKSINTLETDLKQVDSLKPITSGLFALKEQIYSKIVDELHRHIYVRSTNNILKKFKRSSSERRYLSIDGQENPPSRKVSMADILSPASIQTSSLPKRRSPNFASYNNLNNIDGIIEDLTDSDPESDSAHFIAILIESLNLLQKLPAAIQSIKDRTEKELVNIVKRTAREILSSPNREKSILAHKPSDEQTICSRCSLILESETHVAYSLQELCALLYQQFRSVIYMHETIVLPFLKKAIVKSESPSSNVSYSIADLWSIVQDVLQMVADLYFDFNAVSSTERTVAVVAAEPKLSNHASSLAELNSYFLRKRPALSVSVGVSSFNKMKKSPLFKFDLSSHAMSLNAYLQEQKEAMKEKADRLNGGALDSIDMSLNETDQYIVCDPGPENMVTMFNSMMKVVLEIDDELNLEENSHCTLYHYLMQCAKSFLTNLKIDLDQCLDRANKSLEAWKIATDSDIQNRRNENRQFLLGVVKIEKVCRDLVNLVFALPMFADHFLSLLNNLLSNFKETCSSAYRGIVQPESEDKRIISATWAKDEDINRFLKGLPNWPSSQRIIRDGHAKSLASIGTSMTFDESPELIRLRNMKESEILASNLTQDTLIPPHEILSDVSQLKCLGQLQESMEWLSIQIFNISNSLSKHQSDQPNNFLSVPPQQIGNRAFAKGALEISQISEASIASLNELSNQFEELAETCLLVLHLEVRVHCFYYLLRVTKGNFAPNSDTQEPDSDVVQLNKDLSSIDESLSLSIQSWKLKYIFEGVSHLVSTILINSVTSIDRINHNGVKKMCRNIFAIQQTLTNITMSREIALDYARQFFELFYLSPDEILSMIENRAPVFQAQEYINALELIHRNSPNRDQNKLNANKLRLGEILNKIAVHV